jgi:hypothetical protein
MELNTLIPVDTFGNLQKHVRHLAAVDEHRHALTKCGRKILVFFDAIDTSYFYTNGVRYAIPCRFCFPEDYAEYLKENPAAALRAIPSEKRTQASRDNGKKGGRPPRDNNQYPKYCETCKATHLHAKGRKYWTCLTCNTRTEKEL